MTELLVPGLAPSPFRAHFRDLVLDALLESAEAERDLHEAAGHRIRARAAERRAARIRVLLGAPPTDILHTPGRFGPELRRLTTGVWLASLGLLFADVLIFGIKSWTTTVADLGMVVLTIVWFFVSVDALGHNVVPDPIQAGQQEERHAAV